MNASAIQERTIEELEIDLATANLHYYCRMTPVEEIRVPEVMAALDRIERMREAGLRAED